jgi:hypothetical protein
MGRRTDRQDEANRRFSQFCEGAINLNATFVNVNEQSQFGKLTGDPNNKCKGKYNNKNGSTSSLTTTMEMGNTNKPNSYLPDGTNKLTTEISKPVRY